MVYVVETQESLKARLKVLFVFGSIPHHSYWCHQHVCEHLNMSTRAYRRKETEENEWEEDEMEYGKCFVSEELLKIFLCGKSTLFCSSRQI